MHLLAIIGNLRFQDLLDILFLTVVSYHLYLWFRGTKAFKALVGLLGLGIVYTAARTWGLFLTTWVFQVLWQVLVILLIILFQSEIRQVLERVNPLQALGLRKIARPEEWIPGFSEAVFAMAERKIGALVIIERTDRVGSLTTEGQPLEGEPTQELLLSIFQKESPLHDGAILIREGRIVRVACYLPLSPDEGLPKEWGTRHRAALGLSERSDAWVIVTSEERGEVSVARGHELTHVDNAETLSRIVLEAVTPITPPKRSWQGRIQSIFFYRWRIKLGTLALVGAVWLLLAGQQNFERRLKVPLEITNVPPTLEILSDQTPIVAITVRGLRKDVSTLEKKNIRAALDLSSATKGERIFRITRDQILLPNDWLNVVDISPSQVKFNFKEK